MLFAIAQDIQPSICCTLWEERGMGGFQLGIPGEALWDFSHLLRTAFLTVYQGTREIT